MNTKKKITAEVAEKDYDAFVEWRITKGIHYYFHDNYMAFWEARRYYKEYQEKLRNGVKYGKAYKKMVYRNLDNFNLLSIDAKTLKEIFRGVSNYSDIANKYLIQRHGVQVTYMGKGKPNRRRPFGNIYSPSLERLKEIFGNPALLKKILDKNNSDEYYTPRQMRLIANFVKYEDSKWQKKSKKKQVVAEEDIEDKIGNIDDLFEDN